MFKDRFVAALTNVAMWYGFVTLLMGVLAGNFGDLLMVAGVAAVSAWLRGRRGF